MPSSSGEGDSDEPEDKAGKRGLSLDEIGYIAPEGSRADRAERQEVPPEDREPRSTILTREQALADPGLRLSALNAQRKAEAEERDVRATAAAERSTDLTVASNRLAMIAVALSGLAFFTSLAGYRLAFGDDEHDRRWRAEQRAADAEQAHLLRAILGRLPPAPTSTPE